MHAAVGVLHQLNVVDGAERLTALGRHIAQLPADLHVGKWYAGVSASVKAALCEV